MGPLWGKLFSNYNKQMITLSKLPFPLNKASYRKWGLLKVKLLYYLTDNIIRNPIMQHPLYKNNTIALFFEREK